MRTRPERQREAFTLIELLVVIAIIAILMSLALVGFSAVRARGQVVQATNEVSQLALAMQAFKTDSGVDYYPPSVMVIETDGSHPYLKKVFPRASVPFFAANTRLEGDQILVFLLGGPDGLGFSTNPANPMSTSGNRKAPHYNFPSNRLRNRTASFRSYYDTYDTQPYLYFGSGFAGNDYNGTGGGGHNSVSPYIETASPLKFHNSHSFQIVCAGKNGLFGPGGSWTAGTSPYVLAGEPTTIGRGGDDITNFWPGQLGTPK